MAVALDATMLSLLLHQTARLPCFPGTKTPISDARERIDALITDLAKNDETILVPAPALTEFLCIVDEAGPGYLKTIDKKSSFEVAPFDEKAAIEAAEIIKKLKKDFGEKRGPQSDEGWQKVKVDQQIIAIAKAESVDCLYTADGGMVKTAKALKVPVRGLWDLPAPESKTPLLDPLHREANELSAAISSGPEQPSARSADVSSQTEPTPEQAPREDRPGAPTRPLQDSSPPSKAPAPPPEKAQT